MRNYRDLEVWAKAHSLTLPLYRNSQKFPREEIYGVTSQLRRAAASIGANLAEGCGRRTNAEFARFVRIALGSASELDYHLLLSRDLGFLGDREFAQALKELTSVRKMLTSLLNRVQVEVETKPNSSGGAQAKGQGPTANGYL